MTLCRLISLFRYDVGVMIVVNVVPQKIPKKTRNPLQRRSTQTEFKQVELDDDTLSNDFFISVQRRGYDGDSSPG